MSEHEAHHEHGEHCTCGHHEHHHEHGEGCKCGHHDHEHHHEHGEGCKCGHHEHHHEHGENCECGCHNHHDHDEDCGCGCHDHEHHYVEEKHPGVVYTKVRPHDDAVVVSGELVLTGDYSLIREKLNAEMAAFAAAVVDQGGVVGHIKASVSTTSVEMFSVTDVDVMIKTAPQQVIQIILAAIVFYVKEQDAQAMAHKALEALL